MKAVPTCSVGVKRRSAPTLTDEKRASKKAKNEKVHRPVAAIAQMAKVVNKTLPAEPAQHLVNLATLIVIFIVLYNVPLFVHKIMHGSSRITAVTGMATILWLLENTSLSEYVAHYVELGVDIRRNAGKPPAFVLGHFLKLRFSYVFRFK